MRLSRARQTILILSLLAGFTAGCASKVLKYEKTKDLENIPEYDQKLRIKELKPEDGEDEKKAVPPAVKVGKSASLEKKKPSKPKPAVKAKEKRAKPMITDKRLPELEDSEGFNGRRPVDDPFRVGEKVTLALTYMNMTAGYLDMEVLPFVEVNGEKAYVFHMAARTNGLFSRFYSVDDQATTYLSYDTMLPFNFEIKVRESKQLADIRSFFDWKTLMGNYWERRVSKSKGERNKNIEWPIKSFSQNVISAIYYLRTFTLTPGKKLQFRVADEGKNIIFSGEVLRREVLSTDIGDLNTVVVRPNFTVDGVFKPVGEILIWLTDDSRKFVVRIESKIKIGSIVGKLRSIDR